MTPYPPTSRHTRKPLLPLALLAAALVSVATTTGCATTPEPSGPQYTLPSDPFRVVMEQRTKKEIRGLPAWISIRDITAGQVLCEVRRADGEVLIDLRSITTLDVMTLELGDQTFLVKLIKLKNLLVGGDFAVFEVSDTMPNPPSPPPEPDAAKELADVMLKEAEHGGMADEDQ